MRYSLCIRSAPGTAAADTALQFAHALLSQGHQLYRVFFQGDGVNHALTPGDWSHIATQHGVDLVLCSNAMNALPTQAALPSGFSIGGLVLLAEAANHSDRLIAWGNS